eukprot:815623-Alexandrium_andersonii.AAC.1
MEEAIDWTENVVADGGANWFFGGDLNWRRIYDGCVPEHAAVCEMTSATTVANTYPTRAIAKGMEAKHVTTVFVEGIPYHGLAIFTIDARAPVVRQTRLRRTALFEKDPEALITEQDTDDIMGSIDLEVPAMGGEQPLPDRWRRWHERAEGVCGAAVRSGLLQQRVFAERPK